MELRGDQISVGSACRDMEYFVDPESEEMVELGTLEYPYRTMKSVASEILNHLSHHQVEVTVYVKDVYLQDRSLYFVNMTNVKITSHPEYVSSNRKAVITATEFVQSGISKKARFHLLKDTELPLLSIMNSNPFSDYEKSVTAVLSSNAAIRAGIEFNNIDIYREEVDYNKDILFLQAVFLQNLNFKLSKSTFDHDLIFV